MQDPEGLEMALILIVDDDAGVRRALGKVLERDGHTVVAAENGQVGLQLMGERPADLVLADLFMPVMDGLEFISKLRQAHPDVKVLAISGSTYERRPRFLEIAGRMGNVRTLSKPVDSQELTAVVRDMLAGGSES
jgi:two-component system cell cycle sensor histidine kinase/response regulator CckA